MLRDLWREGRKHQRAFAREYNHVSRDLTYQVGRNAGAASVSSAAAVLRTNINAGMKAMGMESPLYLPKG